MMILFFMRGGGEISISEENISVEPHILSFHSIDDTENIKWEYKILNNIWHAMNNEFLVTNGMIQKWISWKTLSPLTSEIIEKSHHE